MNAEELGALSYRELQKLAKSNKISARQPKEALIKALIKTGLNCDTTQNKAKSGKNFNEIFDASIASSIFTDDGKSEAETENDDDTDKNVEVVQPAKRKMSSGVKRKPKRGRYAEFYSAPRTSSPIQSETPNRRSSRGSVLVLSPPPTGEKKTLNSTITINSSAENSRKNSLAKLDRSEEEKEILTGGTSQPANLNETFETKPQNSLKNSIVENRKISVKGSTPSSGSSRKSLLNIPLRKSLVGTPGSIRKARPSVAISSQKLAFAVEKMLQLTPSVNEEGKSVKKARPDKKSLIGNLSKPGNHCAYIFNFLKKIYCRDLANMSIFAFLPVAINKNVFVFLDQVVVFKDVLSYFLKTHYHIF